jgi:hypothetical protein
MQERIESFDEFWPHYVHAHRHPVNRLLHYVGTTGAVACVATGAITLNPAWLVAAPVVGYGCAWVGHFVFEKNKPATFDHPVWSFRADFKMLGMALRGRMADEIERLCGTMPEDHTHADHVAAGHVDGANGTTAATA